MPPFKHKHLAAALASVMLAGALPAYAAGLPQAELLKELRRLGERLEKLETRNAELEKKAQIPATAQDAVLAQRIKALEENNARMEAALESDRLSDKDPEVVTRLKDIEIRTLSMQKQARAIESLEGVTAGASLTMVAQSANKASVAAGNASSALNYRGDVSVTLPGGSIGNAEGIFAQFRLAGERTGPRSTFTSTPNTTAFSLQPGRFHGNARPGLVQAGRAIADRRPQTPFARTSGGQHRQDRPICIFRPERGCG
jgi:hypothetical protein